MMDASTSPVAVNATLNAVTRIDAKSSEFARGWPVLLAATFGVGLGITGLPFFAFGQFVRPLVQTFGWNRGEVSGGITCLMFGTAVMSPFVGRAVDKFGFRSVALISQLGLALGFIGASLVGHSVIGYYVAWLALSFLGAGTSPVVWTRAVAGRFERSRGLALGIMLSGTGIIAIIAPMIVNQIIAHLGWRIAYQVLAGSVFFIGLPMTYIFLQSESKRGSLIATHLGMTMKQALHTTMFWRVIGAFILISMVASGLIVHLPTLLIDRGFLPAAAAAMVGMLGYTIIVGRISLGVLVDRFSPAFVGGGLISLAAVTSILLTQGFAPLLSVLLLGLCCGAEVDLLAFLMSRMFGLRSYAQIYGCGISSFTFGAAFGPILAGRSHDLTGSYNMALYGFAAAIVIATLLIFSLWRDVKPSRS
ncbi:MFS transporter [Beijerinckia sp. L45]|uniref:MFS transporter n=1 Tax=Beijerinckia sp. L45 TaxID=1641855 RepID=UPI00131A70D2|nr:MFS transporter [Beijerinckia sp. L45]